MKKALLVLGAILITLWAHRVATVQRGYWAIGGEFLVVPLIILARSVVGQVVEMMVEFKALLIKKESPQ